MDQKGVGRTRPQNWSREEKLRLYHAIKHHTSHNLIQIRESLPNKTEKEIRDAILFYNKKALKQDSGINRGPKERNNYTSVVPLNSWAKLLTETFPFNELRTETATALRLIADFEQIPPAACTEKIDFRKIYHMLANALEGKTLPDDKNVNFVLNKCIVETALTSKVFMKNNSHKNAIKDIRIHERDVTAFIKLTDDNDLSVVRHLAMHKSYNPLNIPECHLKFSS